jgi:glycosyltransferase involved in cell wall biosynthesis
VSAFHVQPENLLRNIGLQSPRLAAWIHRQLVRRLYDRSAAVVCPSPFALQELRAHGLRAPAEVISNGAPPEFGPAPVERADRHAGKLLVLAIGRLAREKRLDVTIEGIRRSRHAARIQLVVTGRGPEEAMVRRLAASLPVPAEIGYVADEELRRLLGSADLLVHASEFELEGMAVLEALACGTPALVARAPGSAARQFALSEDFLFEPGAPDDLARRLDRLVETPGLLADARGRALALAAGHRLSDSVHRLEQLYLRVAGGRSPG